MSDSFVCLTLIYPHSFFVANEIRMMIVRLEFVGESARPSLHHFRGKLLEISSRSAWSEIELIDVYDTETVMIN